jgi:AcrR family transcriptional regulator
MSSVPESPKAKRTYDSPSRRRRAEDTRAAIIGAARRLFLSEGFGATTIAGIAQAASCSAPTVYAMFGSKDAILAAVIDAASFGARFEQLVAEVKETEDPEQRLRMAVRIARTIYEAERAEFDLLRGAGVVSPEHAINERSREAMRFERQAPVVDLLIATERLRQGLSEERAREILWALTSRDLFRLLVAERGWAPEMYETWLASMLVSALVQTG